jgi:hypothetical protein
MDTSELEAAYRPVLDLAGGLAASSRELLELAGRLDGAQAPAERALRFAVIAVGSPWVSSRYGVGACLGSPPCRPGGYQIGMRKLPVKGCKFT